MIFTKKKKKSLFLEALWFTVKSDWFNLEVVVRHLLKQHTWSVQCGHFKVVMMLVSSKMNKYIWPLNSEAFYSPTIIMYYPNIITGFEQHQLKLETQVLPVLNLNPPEITSICSCCQGSSTDSLVCFTRLEAKQVHRKRQCTSKVQHPNRHPT